MGATCAVTSLASETGAPISAEEFHTFNRLLDDAIAAVVTEYSERKKAPSPLKRATEAALTAAQLEAHEAQIRSLHDSLTGLPNRELFDDRMAKAISLANRHNWTLAVMFLDLNQFKKINVERIATSILRCIAQPLAVAGVELLVKPSIGIVVYPRDGSGGNELIRNADAAMYRAKRHSRGFVLFGE